MLSRRKLHKYQNEAVGFIKDQKRTGLFLDLGLGKTTTSLTAYSDLLEDFEITKVLIVAPLQVAKNVWDKEALNWSHLAHLRFSKILGTEKERLNALSLDSDFYVTNRENIPWLVDYYKSKWPFDAIIIDESSSFKSPKSKRFKKLKSVMKYTSHVTLLTGTPSPNGLTDLWSQIFLLDFGDRLGKTWTNFVNRYFDKSGFKGYVLELREGSEQKIHNQIEDVTISMKASDYIKTVPRVDINRLVEMDNKTRAIYEEIEKELIVEVNNETVETLSIAALGNKLLQICNGSLYNTEGKTLRLNTDKIEALRDIIQDNPEENLLIAYNFKFDLEALLEAFPGAEVIGKNSSADQIERWNRGEIKMLLAHPASAGHGLNLQKGGSMLVWYGLTWSLELYLQFNGRLDRQGQKSTVRVIHLINENTIESKVLSALSNKVKVQDALMAHLKFQ